MYLGKVIGTVVSTSKSESLLGTKLLIVTRLSETLAVIGPVAIAVDTVGAGNGEIVIVTCGSAARRTAGKEQSVIDAAIVGIVDTVEVS
ncbi:microcompartment shell vertex protein GrpN [Rhodopseudomonas palustris]|uniref:Ethanolamine utilization protein EutN/carboxysome structural protein Ccml n=1 Tax=Rhodopseudomonas palustris (strain BisB18) TaxID=316056 RepID=Q21A51_RHOPB